MKLFTTLLVFSFAIALALAAEENTESKSVSSNTRTPDANVGCLYGTKNLKVGDSLYSKNTEDRCEWVFCKDNSVIEQYLCEDFILQFNATCIIQCDRAKPYPCPELVCENEDVLKPLDEIIAQL